MRDMPFVSIVIPAKNEQQDVPFLFESIRQQTYTSYEVILADAESTDRTVEIARAAGVRVVSGGLPGVGRNRGAAVATGEIIVFLDAETVLVSPTFLEDCVREMIDRRLDMASCLVTTSSKRFLDRVWFGGYNIYARLTERIHPHAQGSCMFVRRTVHEALEGFDERVVLCEDAEYAQRLIRHGYRFANLHAHKIYTSVRRMHREGYLRVAAKYMFMEVHLLFKGHFYDHAPIEYVMGGEDRQEGRR